MRAWNIPVPRECVLRTDSVMVHPDSIMFQLMLFPCCFLCILYSLDFMFVAMPCKTVRKSRRLKLQPILICLDLESATQTHKTESHPTYTTLWYTTGQWGQSSDRCWRFVCLNYQGFWWCQDMPRMLKRMRKMTRRKTSPWLRQVTTI